MIVLVKYFHYSNVFLVENIVKLLEYIKIINYVIELKIDK